MVSDRRRLLCTLLPWPLGRRQTSATRQYATLRPHQSPAPGFGEKCWNLSGFPSRSLESGGGGFFVVMFGQSFAYSPFSRNHFSSRLGVRLDRVNRAFRHADPAINAFVRMDDEHVLAFVEAVHRAHLDAIHNLATNAVLVDDKGQLSVPSAGAPARRLRAVTRARAERARMRSFLMESLDLVFKARGLPSSALARNRDVIMR
jgi:hypothetical protein